MEALHNMYDVAIIGAGVIGAAIARELSRYGLKLVVLDKENDVAACTSKANSGIVHAGYDPEEHTLMARLNARGNEMFPQMCQELSVPYKRNGSLVVAFDGEQMEHIQRLLQRGVNNGIPGLSILSREELFACEPAISPEAKGALLAETAGVVDPMLLTISLMENAVANGAECVLNFEVTSIEKEADGSYKVLSKAGAVAAKYVINAAGVYSDDIHNMVAEPAFRIHTRRGHYFLLDKAEGKAVTHTLFPCPTKLGKGILVAPTAHGNLIVGPSSDDIPDKDDVATTEEALVKASDGAKLLTPKISAWRSNIRNFSGLRAEPDTEDFVIGEAKGAPNFIDAAGIKSPGLTSAPAIAVYVADILKGLGLALDAKASFDPIVKRELFIDMPEERQRALIAENPLYGRVICRCENVTEGDIVDAIHRSPGAATIDGVKRRCRAGMGRCQGGFCGPRVLEILARELNRPLEEIMLDKKNSYILIGETK